MLACGLASLSRAIVPTARSETAQETAIGAYSYYGAGAVAGGVVAGAGQHFLLDTGTLCVLGYYRNIPAVKIWNGPLAG